MPTLLDAPATATAFGRELTDQQPGTLVQACAGIPAAGSMPGARPGSLGPLLRRLRVPAGGAPGPPVSHRNQNHAMSSANRAAAEPAGAGGPRGTRRARRTETRRAPSSRGHPLPPAEIRGKSRGGRVLRPTGRSRPGNRRSGRFSREPSGLDPPDSAPRPARGTSTTLAVSMGVTGTRGVEPDGALPPLDVRDGFGVDEAEGGGRVDEPSHQPGGRVAVDPNALAGDPVHWQPCVERGNHDTVVPMNDTLESFAQEAAPPREWLILIHQLPPSPHTSG